eukprot:m.172057 g.172057  ORF g.172057 m.172057 type:complete len:214 (-) comp14569_c0_seq3:2058-2699(-)
MAEEGDLLADISTKLISIPTVCPTCSADVTGVVMHVDMPEFAGKLLNQVKCPYCGFVKTDVVSKDIMTDMGRKFTLKLCAESSWKTRNIMKSSTATVTIPEVGLEGATTAGGTFTTVEELLLNIREEVGRCPSFPEGMDAAEGMAGILDFVTKLNEVLDETMDATLIIEDPNESCFIERIGKDDVHLSSEAKVEAAADAEVAAATDEAAAPSS